METICKRFTSRSLLAETIRNLEERMAPEALAPKVRAKIVPDTRMIEVTVRMRRDEGGSQRAARVTNELISVMQAHRSAKTDAEMETTQKLIEGEMEAAERDIENSDQDIMQFLRGSGDALVWSARADYVLTRLSNLIGLKEKVETLLAAEQKKLHALRAKLEGEPEWMEYSKTRSRDPLWDKYRTDLAELERELAAARAEFGEENPNVRSIEAQISKIREEIKVVAHEVMSATTESRNPTRQALLNQMIEAELNQIAYQAQLDIAEKMSIKLNDEKEQIFSDMPEKQFQLDKMRREVGYKVNIYRILLEKKLEAEIWASENIGMYGRPGGSPLRIKGGIEIVDMAQPGGSPVSPRVKFIGAIAGLVGLAVGLAMAFLAEYFENTYQSLEEVKEDLDVPILGIIPLIKDQQSGTSMIPVLESPMSAEAESFRTLVTNTEFSSPETPHKALLITSSGADEGKSFTTANLAVAMAQTGEQIVLVDCDMRKGVQHKIFGIDNQMGLTNLLVGNPDLGSPSARKRKGEEKDLGSPSAKRTELESVIQDTHIPNLGLISCGPAIPPNPVELLKSRRMSEILSELRETCDVLLCDSPPVLPVADALILASKLDGVLLVTDLNRTPREVIRQAREQLSKLGVPLLGLVCNRVGAVKYDSYYYGSHASRDTGRRASTFMGTISHTPEEDKLAQS
jgi:Mrp family chromosome partitioning ATPase/uncharacterized protein involved in exopolysaccharide biosynthesis